MTLKEWMKKRNIKPMDLAAEIGVAERTVFEWAQRKRSPRLEVAARLVEKSSGDISYTDLLSVKESQRIAVGR